jgi:hypothetical protein
VVLNARRRRRRGTSRPSAPSGSDGWRRGAARLPGVKNMNRGAHSGAAGETRSDLQRPAKRVEAVFHVGEPVATIGGADIKAATVVGNLDGQLVRLLA